MRIRQSAKSKISGPLALCNVMITLSLTSGLESSGSWTRVTLASQPSNFPVTSTRAAVFSRFWPEPVNTSAAITSVLYESNGQLPGSPCASMVMLTCACAVQRIIWIDKHIHRQAVCDGIQLLEAHLHNAVLSLDLAQVHCRERRR